MQYNHKKAKSNQQTTLRSVHVYTALCKTVAHSNAQNIPDNFPSYPPDNHHFSDDVYFREGGKPNEKDAKCTRAINRPMNRK